MPTLAHIIYIPLILMIGIVIGYMLANHTAKESKAAALARKKRRVQQAADAATSNPNSSYPHA